MGILSNRKLRRTIEALVEEADGLASTGHRKFTVSFSQKDIGTTSNLDAVTPIVVQAVQENGYSVVDVNNVPHSYIVTLTVEKRDLPNAVINEVATQSNFSQASNQGLPDDIFERMEHLGRYEFDPQGSGLDSNFVWSTYISPLNSTARADPITFVQLLADSVLPNGAWESWDGTYSWIEPAAPVPVGYEPKGPPPTPASVAVLISEANPPEGWAVFGAAHFTYDYCKIEHPAIDAIRTSELQFLRQNGVPGLFVNNFLWEHWEDKMGYAKLEW